MRHFQRVNEAVRALTLQDFEEMTRQEAENYLADNHVSEISRDAARRLLDA